MKVLRERVSSGGAAKASPVRLHFNKIKKPGRVEPGGHAGESTARRGKARKQSALGSVRKQGDGCVCCRARVEGVDTGQEG